MSLFGILFSIMSSILIGAIISSVSISSDNSTQWILPTLSITITIIITTNGFFNFAKLAEANHHISTGFNNLVRKIETSLLQKNNPKTRYNDFINQLSETFNQLVKDAPSLPLYAKNILSKGRSEAPNPFDDLI